VTLDVLPAEEDYRELGLTDQIASIEALTSSQTMHVFVSKDNKLANDASKSCACPVNGSALSAPTSLRLLKTN